MSDLSVEASALGYAQSIIDSVRDPMLVLDADLRIKTASRAFCLTFKVTPEETEGKLVYELGNGQWNIPRLRELLEVILPERNVFNNFEITHNFPNIGQRTMLLNARKIWREHNHINLVLLAMEDVTDRHNTEREKRNLGELYKRLLASSPDCIKLLDLGGSLLTMNERGQQALGIPDLDSVLGSCWLEFWRGEDHLAAQQALDDARDGKTAEFEGFFATFSGEPNWWHVVVSPVLGPDQKPEYLLAVSRNISHRKQFEEKLQQAHQELQSTSAELRRSNEDLEQFARVVAHDLRAPLNTMVQFSQLLRRRNPELNEESQGIMEHIVDGGKRMAQLLEDMMRYAMAAQAPLAASAPIAAGAACTEATDNLRATIEQTGSIVDCDIPDEVMVNLETSLLVQVFQNLVGNAIHYRREQVRAAVRVSARGQDGHWRFCVTDNGIGIEQLYHQQIFEPFRRLHGTDRPGSGIGLATCRRVIERAGGRIWVESCVSEGSHFQFLLPKANN